MSKIVFNKDVEVKGHSLLKSIEYGSLVNTNSFYGGNTTANQSYRNVVDDYQSHHYYDRDGPNVDNLQYLQLDAATNYPSNLAAAMNSSYYEDASSVYMFGVSTQSVFYNSPAGLASDDLNAMTRRELFNILQDIETIKSDFKDASNNPGYSGFTEVWNKGFQDKNDRLTTGLGTKLGVTDNAYVLKYGGSDDSWTMGNYQCVWRYDVKARTVISRQVVNMMKAVDPSGDWILCAAGRGPVTHIGEGRFVTSIPSFSTNGIIVFDKDLTPITNIIQSSFDSFTRGAYVNPNNFAKRGQLSWGIYQEQFNSIVSKKWSPVDLSGLTFKSLITGQTVNVFNTNDGNATLLYVNSSSQGQYGASEAVSSFISQGLQSLLADYKWNQSKGKMIQYSLFRDASNNNKWTLEPVNVFYTCPDDYKPGDKLHSASFIVDPETGVTQPLQVYYPLVDNRDIVTDISGYSSLVPPGAWNESWRQLKFSDGSNNTLPKTAGLQTFCVSVYDVSGASWNVGGISPTLRLDGRQFYQDVYATVYKKFTDASLNRYYQQNDLDLGQVILTDPSCIFYPYTSPKKYIDLSGNRTFSWNDASAAYLDSNSQFDPSPNATVRKNINNAGFCKRYMMASYQLDPSANAIDTTVARTATSGLTIPVGCPFSDVGPTNCNPQPPPWHARGRNTGAIPINAQFYFKNNDVFDSTEYYYSRPYSLTWVDRRYWAGNTFGLTGASTVNTNYGKTKVLDGALVKEFFRLCQTAQGNDATQHAVQVLLENETYTDLSGVTNVPVGSIAFKVRGDVLNGQPMLMTIDPNCIDNLVLTPILCNQLNFYGAGIYGMPSWFNDSKGKTHLLTGSSNGNYMPYSDMFYPAEFTAKKLCQDIKSILDGSGASELRNKVSRNTLIKLGFNNVNWNSQPSESNYYRGVKSAIRDQSGNILLESTLRGIIEFRGILGQYASQLKAGQSTNQSLYANEGGWTDLEGNKVNFTYDIACNFEFIYPSNYPVFSGKEILEAQEIFYIMHTYRGRPLSNRIKRWSTQTPCILDPKTMALEHMVKSYIDCPELFSQLTRELFKVTPESYLIDVGFNRDEINGIVTCGNEVISSANKVGVRLFFKKDVESKYVNLTTYPDASANRKNFAISNYSILGTTTNPDNTINYGSKFFYLAPILAASISGTNSYLGNINGKDVFVYGSTTLIGFNGHTTFFDAIPKIQGCTYNYEKVRNIVPTDDNSMLIIPPRNVSGILKNMVGNDYDRPQGYKYMCAYTISDDRNSVKPIWITIVPALVYPQLVNISANPGSDTTGAAKSGTVLVNDLIFEGMMREVYAISAVTGEIVATYYGDDFEYDEKNFRNFGFSGADSAKRANTVHIGSVNYNSGELHLITGGRRFGNVISAWGRQIFAMKLKRNDKLNMPYSSLYLGSGNTDIVFKAEDALAYNGGKFTLISTFITNDRYGKLQTPYPAIDLSYNMAYHTGITAFAIDTSSESALSSYNNATSLDDKIVNGGSWYANSRTSFANIKSKILFMYAGPIPSRCGKQTPYIVDSRMVAEAKSIRNQKILLREYLRIKNSGNTYPYPDNGSFIAGDTRKFGSTGGYLPLNDIKYNFYLNATDNTTLNSYNASFNKYNYSSGAPAQSQIFNQPLGYTDVGTGRPFANQTGYDKYGSPL